MHVVAILAGIDDPVIGGGRHQQHHGQGDQPEAQRVHDPRAAGQRLKGLRQHNRQLETEQGLGARQDHPRLGQHLLDLDMERRRRPLVA